MLRRLGIIWFISNHSDKNHVLYTFNSWKKCFLGVTEPNSELYGWPNRWLNKTRIFRILWIICPPERREFVNVILNVPYTLMSSPRGYYVALCYMLFICFILWTFWLFDSTWDLTFGTGMILKFWFKLLTVTFVFSNCILKNLKNLLI